MFQTSAQQALTGTINSSMQAVQAAQASLSDSDTLPPLGTDAVRDTKLFLKFATLHASYTTEIAIWFKHVVVIMIFMLLSCIFFLLGLSSLEEEQDG